MARPIKPRCICCDPRATYFKPRAIPLSQLEEVVLRVDELEALRLCDAENFDQAKAARALGVSRSTLQRILALARKKVSEALVAGKALRIER